MPTAQTSSAAKPSDDLINCDGRLVTIIVGREKKNFSIHLDILCASSDFFRAALNPKFGFKEAGGSQAALVTYKDKEESVRRLESSRPSRSSLWNSSSDHVVDFHEAYLRLLKHRRSSRSPSRDSSSRDSSSDHNVGQNKRSKLEVNLPEACPIAFATYAHWVYRQTLPKVEAKDCGSACALTQRLADNYILGDQIQDAKFRSDCMDALVDFSNAPALTLTPHKNSIYFMMGSIVNHIEGRVPPNSPLRKFVLRCWIINTSTELPVRLDNLKSLSCEFVANVLLGLLDQKRVAKPARWNAQLVKSAFHEKKAGESCARPKKRRIESTE